MSGELHAKRYGRSTPQYVIHIAGLRQFSTHRPQIFKLNFQIFKNYIAGSAL